MECPRWELVIPLIKGNCFVFIQFSVFPRFIMLLSVSFFICLVNLVYGFPSKIRLNDVLKGPSYGAPLFLTPYINAGQIDVARAASMVHPLKSNVSSYAGYLTVNETYNSNMFMWYFPAENTPEQAPVIVWLQGGPGVSSLLGLFEENGPFYVKLHKGLKMRDIYWSQAFHVIYIDNPVGTGFSFTDEGGYCTDQDCIAQNLYEALLQFFTMFPDLQKNDFFVTGESYAGKYVPALSHAIHTNNPSAKLKINLKGMAIGNGFCDPVSQTDYSDYFYEIGIVDDDGKNLFSQVSKNVVNLINQKEWQKAHAAFDNLIVTQLTNSTSYLFNLTGFSYHFNYLYYKEDSPYGNLVEYLNKDVVRRSIHTGNLTFFDGKEVVAKLDTEYMQSVAPLIAEIANNYRVLFYNGQLDVVVPYPLTVNFLKNLQWCGSDEYKTAKRNVWKVNGDVAGYSKTVAPPKCSGSLTEVLVRDAGHLVPEDQPLWALDLMIRFTLNKPF